MVKYNVINNGHKEWVVFVHGIAGSTLTWKKQIEDFSKRYNLLLLDLPGHGSNSSNVIHHVNIRKLNLGIKQTLDHLGISHAHFVGMSLGTLVISIFAIEYPEYVDDMILGGAAMLVTGIYRTCVQLANGIKHYVPYKPMYHFFSWFLMPNKNHEKSRKIFIREAKKLDKHTMFAWIEYLTLSLKGESLAERLNRLNIKTLFISGDEDYCFLNGVKKIFSKVHNTQLMILHKCGHVCSIERWRDFNRIALDALQNGFDGVADRFRTDCASCPI